MSLSSEQHATRHRYSLLANKKDRLPDPRSYTPPKHKLTQGQRDVLSGVVILGLFVCLLKLIGWI